MSLNSTKDSKQELNQSFIVCFKPLLLIVSCVFRNGFISLINRASNVNKWTSPFVVEPKMSTLSSVMPWTHILRCDLTGPF